jgi:hypothetical protein
LSSTSFQYPGVGEGELNLGFTTETHNIFSSCCIIMGFCDGCAPPVIEYRGPQRGAPFVVVARQKY